MATVLPSSEAKALSFVRLANRGVLQITGDDRRPFLQGLVSNDVNKVTPERVLYTALLTAQGKYAHDFFIAEIEDSFFLDAEASRLADLERRLRLYKLRARIEISQANDRFFAAAFFGENTLSALGLPQDRGRAIRVGAGIAYVDPRLAELGARLLLPRATSLAAPLTLATYETDADAYDRWRLSLGVPDGSRDMAVDKALLLESGFDELDGIDWQKGCYVGQELTARTKYRGLVKKRLMPVTIDGTQPEPGAPIMLGEREVGEMRSGREGRGMALLRLDAVEECESTGAPLIAGAARLVPRRPAWANF